MQTHLKGILWDFAIRPFIYFLRVRYTRGHHLHVCVQYEGSQRHKNGILKFIWLWGRGQRAALPKSRSMPLKGLQPMLSGLSRRYTSCCCHWAWGLRWWGGWGPRTTRCQGLLGSAACPRLCLYAPGRTCPLQSNPGRTSTAGWWWNSGQCIWCTAHSLSGTPWVQHIQCHPVPCRWLVCDSRLCVPAPQTSNNRVPSPEWQWNSVHGPLDLDSGWTPLVDSCRGQLVTEACIHTVLYNSRVQLVWCDTSSRYLVAAHWHWMQLLLPSVRVSLMNSGSIFLPNIAKATLTVARELARTSECN